MKFSYFYVHFIFGWQWEKANFIAIILAKHLIIFTDTSLTFLLTCIWDLSLQQLFLSFWRLRLLCSSSSSMALALQECERFLVPSSLSMLGLSEVFIVSMTFLEIWLPSAVICCPRVSTHFSKHFPYWVTSGSWTGGSVISLIFKVSLFDY